ncbi:MAG TPA: FAD-dependent oxidoreductase, partial [Dermatophilaceae bacterium]|nr:FAD-dependent oxidoreductase [Dermatophilaceae bacterium]
MPARRRSSQEQLLGSLVRWRLQTGQLGDLSDDEAVHQAGGLRRRDFLRSVVLAGAGIGLAACTGSPQSPAAATPSPTASAAVGARVVVVGAGLAGLTAAYRLHQAGVASRVFEARDRVGGRCWSSTGWADGRIGEHGGEFIDTRHVHIRGLAKEFGLTFGDTWRNWDPGSV